MFLGWGVGGGVGLLICFLGVRPQIVHVPPRGSEIAFLGQNIALESHKKEP